MIFTIKSIILVTLVVDFYLLDENCKRILFSLQGPTMKVIAVMMLVALATVSLADSLMREKRFLQNSANDVRKHAEDVFEETVPDNPEKPYRES